MIDKKLAIVTTHPIQYYAPLFQLLAKETNLMVFYTWGEGSLKKFDPGFGKVIEWDIPLLEDYPYQFLKNESKYPGSHHFKGIINPNLIEHIEEFNPDAIMLIGYAYQSHLQVLRHFKGKTPLWFRGDSTLLDKDTGWKKYIKSIYLKWVYSHVDLAFYVGTANKAYFKKYGLKERQLVFAPHAIDSGRFLVPRKNEAKALRARLGLSKLDILILFAGKFEPKKNPLLLLDAFIALNLPNAHLLFVGNGVLEESLKWRVETLKLKVKNEERKDNRVHFMNFQNQSQMPVVYQASDIFCLPSQGPGETWGLAINEAMISRNAIIASNKVGCAIDLVKNGENGYVFESSDLEGLKVCLSKITLSPSIHQMKDKSQDIIKEWSISNQLKAFINQLNEKNQCDSSSL
ncbi:glycosyltransferase family 4 protein [Pedobacter aquae]|uniref:Glycosyltransferase family 4 protein n=1 Tax=Pedobacter aquae TaxID=2605747 RepID=A0A5C0VFE6_9SPHI|nr:glycosyltransferase family 4 protein [Pedobacter aquae]QEK50321.1 glycosyltransferase family 4 protein [Pedobacter aquae]